MKISKELKKLALECLMSILDDNTKKTVIGFAKPLSKVKYKAKATRFRQRDCDVRITIGRTNYAEKQYLKLCKKSNTRPEKYWIKFFK